ncbi:MAG: hypothetical protein H0T45_18420 [Pyrinomonadaceae bacterium]|nr:hypothetical protein [Pyrinomonadaceae bacterium]
MPERGLYLSSTGKNHLYVSRTNRLREHCSEGRTHLTAAIACRIARLETGHVRASYRKEVFRASLMG